MARDTSIKPQGIRTILSIILSLAVLGGGALFYLGLMTVKEYSADVNNRLIDADASEAQIRQLQALRQQINQNETLIAKADNVFATPANYQAQALNDVRSYANQTGVSVRSIDFDDPSGGSYTMLVRLNSPTNYESLIRFITLIEGNLPKLQLTELDVKRGPANAKASVTVNELKINVSVR